MYNFSNKIFRITLIEGPETEVNENTTFSFSQNENVIWANYSGGNVKHGHLIGVLQENKLHHRYVQININNEINSGEGNSEIQLNSQGKLEIIEEWEWQNKVGNGRSIMTEI